MAPRTTQLCNLIHVTRTPRSQVPGSSGVSAADGQAGGPGNLGALGSPAGLCLERGDTFQAGSQCAGISSHASSETWLVVPPSGLGMSPGGAIKAPEITDCYGPGYFWSELIAEHSQPQLPCTSRSWGVGSVLPACSVFHLVR